MAGCGVEINSDVEGVNTIRKKDDWWLEEDRLENKERNDRRIAREKTEEEERRLEKECRLAENEEDRLEQEQREEKNRLEQVRLENRRRTHEEEDRLEREEVRERRRRGREPQVSVNTLGQLVRVLIDGMLDELCTQVTVVKMEVQVLPNVREEEHIDVRVDCVGSVSDSYNWSDDSYMSDI